MRRNVVGGAAVSGAAANDARDEGACAADALASGAAGVAVPNAEEFAGHADWKVDDEEKMVQRCCYYHQTLRSQP